MLARLWYWLFYACQHEWKIIDSATLHHDGSFNSMPVGKRFTLQCTKCGNIKSKKFVT